MDLRWLKVHTGPPERPWPGMHLMERQADNANLEECIAPCDRADLRIDCCRSFFARFVSLQGLRRRRDDSG